MSMGLIIFEAIVIFFLIILNGLFSGSEIAILTARRSILEKLVKNGKSSAHIASRLKDDPNNFMATVQIGVTVVSTLASVVGGVLAIQLIKPVLLAIPFSPIRTFVEPLSIGIVVVVISFGMLVLGELAPKSLALHSSERFACATARTIYLLSKIAAPFIKVLTTSSGVILRIVGIKEIKKDVFISKEEIKYFLKAGRARGIFKETEEALIQGVFEFADMTAAEIMITKPKISAIEVTMPPKDALRFIVEKGFSRFPVYKGNIDKVVGILYNKDVFKILEEKRPLIISEAVRKPYFVPDSILISRLLREMQRKRTHMAMIVNEHGDVDGIVTIEDILEEIVGEIEDEFDIEKDGLIERQRDGSLLMDAAASLRDIKGVGLPFTDEDEDVFSTLAGFMLAKLQKIPKGGEFTDYKGFRFTVVDVAKRRIIKVKAEKIGGSKYS